MARTGIAALRVCDITIDPVADALHIRTTGQPHATTPPELVTAGARRRRKPS